MKYRFFSVASDIMVVRKKGRGWECLLIQRKKAPFKNKWALPGGFVDRKEDALTAAKRELREETALRCKRFVEFGSFSAPGRDPRGRTLTVAFYAVLRDGDGDATAGDDAGRAEWFSTSKLPPLAFDHDEMIAKGLLRFEHDRKCKRLSRR